MDRSSNRESVAGVILTAGLGRRMRPITETVPKPLLPVLGIPLFEVIAEKLLRSGAARIHCNLFHLGERIEAFASSMDRPLTFHHEERLLGIGGGIGHMAQHLERYGVIMIHNGDIVSNIDFAPVLRYHAERGQLVTLVLSPEGPVRNVWCTGTGEVRRFGTFDSPDEPDVKALGYTGLSVISAGALSFFPRGVPGGLAPILHAMIEEHPGSVHGLDISTIDPRYLWNEIGSPRSYLDVHRTILVEKTVYDRLLPPPPLPLHVGEGAFVAPDAVWRGFLEVGPGARVGRNTVLENCVILEGTAVPGDTSYRNAIIYPGGSLETERSNE